MAVVPFRRRSAFDELVDAERRIASERARLRMEHLKPYVPSWEKPPAQLLRPLIDRPTASQPTIKPVPRRSIFARIFGRAG